MAWRKPRNLREWFQIVFRHKKKFFFPALAVAAFVMVAGHRMPREYTAQASFRRINDLTMQQMGENVSTRNLQSIRRSMYEDIRGRKAVDQVIEDLGLTRSFPHRDGVLTSDGQIRKHDMIRRMQGNIRISTPIRSNQMDQVLVSYTDADGALAPKVANRLVENYMRETRQHLNETLNKSQGFFRRETDRYRKIVSELDAKRLQHEMDNPGLMPDDPGSLKEKLAALGARQAAARSELRVAQNQYAELRNWVQNQPEHIVSRELGQNPILGALLERRNRLIEELDAHLNGAGMKTEKHPDVVRTRMRLAEIDKQIGATQGEVETGRTQETNQQRILGERELETLSGKVTGLEREADELQKEMDYYEALGRNFFVVRSKYMTIVRDLDEAREQLGFWERNQRQTKMALNAENAQQGIRIRPLDRADENQRKPSSPTMRMILAAALFLGLGAGALLVLVSEMMDHTCRSAEQAIDELKLPVLGAVNEIVTPKDAFRRKVLSMGVYPTLACMMGLVLLVAALTMYLSLNHPNEWAQLKGNPASYAKQVLRGP